MRYSSIKKLSILSKHIQFPMFRRIFIDSSVMALAQSIVKQHGGEILVSSTDQGSEFELRFLNDLVMLGRI